MQAFKRLYYATLALFLAAFAGMWVIVPLSYALLGFDPSVRDAYSVESFQAARATAPIRRGFGYGVLVLAVVMVVLSVTALVLRRRRRIDVPWLIPMTAALGAAVAALYIFAALIAPTGICC